MKIIQKHFCKNFKSTNFQTSGDTSVIKNEIKIVSHVAINLHVKVFAKCLLEILYIIFFFNEFFVNIGF